MNYLTVLVSGIAAIIVAIVTVLASRKKVRADATETLTNIALSLVEPQKTRISLLETKQAAMLCQIEKLEAENRALHSWAQLLFTQVVENGGEPIPFDTVTMLNK